MTVRPARIDINGLVDIKKNCRVKIFMIMKVRYTDIWKRLNT